jgi:hypothetical protein
MRRTRQARRCFKSAPYRLRDWRKCTGIAECLKTCRHPHPHVHVAHPPTHTTTRMHTHPTSYSHTRQSTHTHNTIAAAHSQHTGTHLVNLAGHVRSSRCIHTALDTSHTTSSEGGSDSSLSATVAIAPLRVNCNDAKHICQRGGDVCGGDGWFSVTAVGRDHVSDVVMFAVELRGSV